MLISATARLVRERMPGRRVIHSLAFGQTEALTADTAITLHQAGHILGSALCSCWRHAEHGTLLYTGDFKLHRSSPLNSCAAPRADLVDHGDDLWVAPLVMCLRRLSRVFADLDSVLPGDGRRGRANRSSTATASAKPRRCSADWPTAGLPIMPLARARPSGMTQIYAQRGVALPSLPRVFPPRARPAGTSSSARRSRRTRPSWRSSPPAAPRW